MSKINKVLVGELGQMIMTATPRTALVEAIEKYRAAGLTERRFLWDCLWSVPHETRAPWFGKVYAFANDDHITTALKSWFKSTGLTY